MIRYLLLLSIFATLTLASGLAEASRTAQVHIVGHYGLDYASMNLVNNRKARYSGSHYGGAFGGRLMSGSGTSFSNLGYGLGFEIGYDQFTLDNTGNNTANETATGGVVSIMGRFYALNMYVGLGGLYSPFSISYKSSPTSSATTENYTAVGARLETGIDIMLGKKTFLAPKTTYDLMRATPSSGGGAKQFNNFSLSAGLGVRF